MHENGSANRGREHAEARHPRVHALGQDPANQEVDKAAHRSEDRGEEDEEEGALRRDLTDAREVVGEAPLCRVG